MQTDSSGDCDASAAAAAPAPPAHEEKDASGSEAGRARQHSVPKPKDTVEAEQNCHGRQFFRLPSAHGLVNPFLTVSEKSFNLDDLGASTHSTGYLGKFTSASHRLRKSFYFDDPVMDMNVHKHLRAIFNLMKAYGLTPDSFKSRLQARAKQYKGLQRSCFELTQRRWFEALVVTLVCINFLLQLRFLLSERVEKTDYENIASACFQACFVVELAIRWYGCPVHPRYTDAALMLDIFLVCLTGVSHIDLLFGEGSGTASFLSGVTVLRMVRIYRLFLVGKFRPMTIAFAAATLAAILLLFPLMIALFANAAGLRAMFIFDSHQEGAHVSENDVPYFETTAMVFLTILESFFTTWSWSAEITTPLTKSHLVMSSVTWLAFQLFGTVLLANFVSAMIVQESCQSGDQADRDSFRRRIVRGLLDMDLLLEGTNMVDPSGTGRVQVHGLDEHLKSHHVRRKLGLTEEQADVVVESLYQSERSWVTVDEFVTLLLAAKSGHDSIEQLMFDAQVKKINADISRMRHQVELLSARFSACNLLHVEYMDNKAAIPSVPRDEIHKRRVQVDELCQTVKSFPFVEEDPELVLISDLDSQGVCHQLASLERMIAALPQAEHIEESSGVHADSMNAFDDGAEGDQNSSDTTRPAPSSAVKSCSTTCGVNASTDVSRSTDHQGLAAIAADARFAASLARYQQVAHEELAAARRQLMMYREAEAVRAASRMGHPGIV